MIEYLSVWNSDTGQHIDMGTDKEYNFVVQEGGFDPGNIAANHNTFVYPGQIGSFIANTTLGNRSFGIAGFVVCDTLEEIERRKRFLSTVVNPLQELEIRIGEYSVFGKPSSTVQYGKTYDENNDVLCKFMIDVLCYRPMYQKTQSDIVNLALLMPAFHFPLTIKPAVFNGGVIFGKRKKELLQEIINDGVVPVGVEIFIEAGGIVNNPKIVFIEQNKYIQVKKVLRAGESVIISTVDGERYIKGRESVDEEYTSYLDYWNEGNTWLQALVGTTTIGFNTSEQGVQDDTFKNVDITIKYKRCFFNLDNE